MLSGGWMARYLITGIAGFIGSTLAHALVEQGHEVRGIDNLSTGSLDNIADIRKAIDFEQTDLQDVAGIKSACKGVDFVLHQGAVASVPRSVKDPVGSHESNINGTLNLLIAARDAKVKRIVYAASSSAYVNPKSCFMQPPCEHNHTEIIARRDGVEYLECLDCRQIFEAEDLEPVTVEEEDERSEEHTSEL